MQDHEYYMKRCIELALKGGRSVMPNPLVGSVIVCEGKIIGEGFHEKFGGPHAEVNAIASVSDPSLLKHSTIYVTLEPCSHHGKTPPCADLIISKGIPVVVIGSMDTNPLVGGKGAEKLRAAGVKVITGMLENECRSINKRFFTLQEKKRPYIILKWAQTKDGFIDLKREINDDQPPSRITGWETQRLVHEWRAAEAAILVGTNTAVLDNPMLTTREVRGVSPLRIAIDKNLRIPATHHLLDRQVRTLIFNGSREGQEEQLEYIKIPFENTLSELLHELAKREVSSVIVEGGSKLLQSFIDRGLWDEAKVFIADKKLHAGVKAPLLEALPHRQEKIGEDLLELYENTAPGKI